MARPKKNARPDASSSGDTAPLNNAFAGLSLSGLPDGPTEAAAPAPEVPTESARLVVQREKKGRGGKTVTRLSGLVGDTARREALARTLAKALGARGWVEDGDVLLAGDQRETVGRVLEREGLGPVVIGN